MNKLPMAKRVAVISALVEGNSLRSTVRMTGVAMNTCLKLLADVGEAAVKLHDERIVGVKAERIQVDEIWQFVGCKDKNVKASEKGTFGRGDVWTWVCIDADSKLILSFLLGNRSPRIALSLMEDLKSRITCKPQITTDGLRAYKFAIDEVFGMDVDYAQIQKVYGSEASSSASPGPSGRYSPRPLVGITKEVIRGNPDANHVSTSYVERQNLTMRMGMRRYTRLTNAFSKKLENHIHATALHFVFYNFCRVHKTLRVTPAMEAGLTDHVWQIEELISSLLG